MQLVLGTVGAVVGGAIGGPAGAQIGFMVGSFLGGLLDPPKMEGPRRTDLKLQHSSYGSPIPLLWGTSRVAGNVIWQPEQMTEHSHTSGGKGGPKQTTYTYTCSFAILLCAARRFDEPAILGIRRIWGDGRLLSENGFSTDELPFTLYYGTETQEPDPTIEADKGAGNVPGYRGLAYMVFNELLLTDFGDRIPSIEVEVIASGGGQVEKVASFDEYIEGESYTSSGGYLPGMWIDGNQVVESRYIEDEPYSQYIERRWNLRTGAFISQAPTVLVTNVQEGWTGITWRGGGNTDLAYSALRGTGTNGYDENRWYKAGIKGNRVDPPTGEQSGTSAFYHAVANKLVVYENRVYAAANTNAGASNRVRIYRWQIGDDGFPVTTADDEWFDLMDHSIFHGPGDVSAGNITYSFDTADGFLYVMSASGATDSVELFKIDPSDMSLVEQWALVGSADLQGDGSNEGNPSNNVNGRGFTVHRGLICMHGSGSGTSSTSVQLFDITSGSPSSFTWLDNADKARIYGLWTDMGGGYFVNQEGIFRVTAQGTLAEIVADVCELAGLTSSQYDVDDLTDTVLGYHVASQMTARNAIEPLRQAYFFDAAEVDYYLLFKHRNHDSIVTIPTADLAAHEFGSTPPAVIEIERIPDHEIPKRVNTTYINPDIDYQTSTQYDERQTGASVSNVSLDLPIVMDDNFARSVSAINVFVAVIERETAKIYTTRKYEYIVPTDVVYVEDRAWRVVSKRSAKSGVIEFVLKPSKPIIFDQPTTIGVVPAVVSTGGSQSPQNKVDTELVLMDIPLLAQSDAPYGFYAAMAPAPGQSGVWAGAALYKSLDGGTSYVEVASTTTADVIGYSQNALGNYTGDLGDIDAVNYVDVVLHDSDSTLTSTNATGLANGMNMAALWSGTGWEIFQFQDVVLLSGATYRLYNLMRGIKESNDYIPTHDVNDTFVLLPAINVTAPESELNVPLYYKAVTFGKTLASATAVLFTNTGVRNEQYYTTISNNLPVFSCDYGSPSSTRAGLVPAPTLADCVAERILSVHGWIDAPTGTGGGGSIYAYDEGTFLGAIQSINFVGGTVSSSLVGSPQRLNVDIAAASPYARYVLGESFSGLPFGVVLTGGDGIQVTYGGGSPPSQLVVTATANMIVFTTSYSASITIDLTNYRNYARVVANIGVLTGNLTLNIINGTDGQVIIVRLKQDSVGGRTITYGSSLRFSSSLPAPTLSTTANKIDRLAFEWFDGPGSPSGYADLVAINFGY